ncbi:MAG: MGMT family protein [Clostridia bacterium]|nr:MGMT family protein [Clostridia bacterium]
MSGEIFEKIYAVVRKIPKGKVATYGQVAAAAGNPHWSQVVGYALHANPDPATIKCYRVVNRFGGLSPAFAFGGIHAHAELLRQDGIVVREDMTVDLGRYLVDISVLSS